MISASKDTKFRFPIGTQFRLKLPPQLPAWVSKGWSQDIKKHDGKILTIKTKASTPNWLINKFDIHPSLVRVNETAYNIHLDWLIPISEESSFIFVDSGADSPIPTSSDIRINGGAGGFSEEKTMSKFNPSAFKVGDLVRTNLATYKKILEVKEIVAHYYLLGSEKLVYWENEIEPVGDIRLGDIVRLPTESFLAERYGEVVDAYINGPYQIETYTWRDSTPIRTRSGFNKENLVLVSSEMLEYVRAGIQERPFRNLIQPSCYDEVTPTSETLRILEKTIDESRQDYKILKQEMDKLTRDNIELLQDRFTVNHLKTSLEETKFQLADVQGQLNLAQGHLDLIHKKSLKNPPKQLWNMFHQVVEYVMVGGVAFSAVFYGLAGIFLKGSLNFTKKIGRKILQPAFFVGRLFKEEWHNTNFPNLFGNIMITIFLVSLCFCVCTNLIELTISERKAKSKENTQHLMNLIHCSKQKNNKIDYLECIKAVKKSKNETSSD